MGFYEMYKFTTKLRMALYSISTWVQTHHFSVNFIHLTLENMHILPQKTHR